MDLERTHSLSSLRLALSVCVGVTVARVGREGVEEKEVERFRTERVAEAETVRARGSAVEVGSSRAVGGLVVAVEVEVTVVGVAEGPSISIPEYARPVIPFT
jgi:hypothetical protein